MNQLFIRSTARATLVAIAMMFAAGFAHATAASDDRSLARGAVEDVTAQQKYRSAVREAGGGYKESLRECGRIAGIDRQICIREAKATYARDMAEAKLLLQ